jgi:hypothetical protein
MKTFG